VSKCAVCISPERVRIERVLGKWTDTKCAVEFGLKINTIAWHRRNHQFIEINAKTDKALGPVETWTLSREEHEWIQFCSRVSDEMLRLCENPTLPLTTLELRIAARMNAETYLSMNAAFEKAYQEEVKCSKMR
jgi:hypothetical protein